jgi:hypothetical protein
MEILFIFAAGWVLSHAFSEKRDEYQAAQDAHREKYLDRLNRRHPSWTRARKERYLQNAARRNALGHMAYLLRHGWSSTFNDVHHGWKNAKAAHEEWKAEREANGEKPGWWQTFKAGWKKRWAERKKTADKRANESKGDRPDPTPDPEPTPKKEEEDNKETPKQPGAPPESNGDASVHTLHPKTNWQDQTKSTSGGTAGSTDGSTSMEAPNLDAARASVQQEGAKAASSAAGLEQVSADVMAGGLGADSESMQHLTNMQEALRNAAAYGEAFATSTGKHSAGQEYANTGHAAKTEFLKSS